MVMNRDCDAFKYDVFISHSSESSLAFVEELAEWLENENGLTCWYAPRNLNNTGAGRDYDDEIVFAIQNTRCLVVVLNDDALKSRWVKHEISQAEKQNKMIIPFAVSELSVNNGLLMRLEDRHIISAYPDPKRFFPVLLKNVKRVLGHDVSEIIIEKEDEDRIKPSSAEIDLDYEEGRAFLDVNRDTDAFIAFLRSAKNGNIGAENALVELAQKNRKNPQFIDDSIWEEIEELSDNGRGFADLLMHFKYFSMGNQNEVAIKYLLRSMKKYESAIAYLQMGLCREWGLGVSVSDILALNYYKKALEKGCALAYHNIGKLYSYGGETIEKDAIKAEEYLKKGIDNNVDGCYESLYTLYYINGEKRKAQEVAEQMLDLGVKGGYTLMGKYYQGENDLAQATGWYEQAIRHKEKGAWGNLALLYWINGDDEKAYRLARKGYWENESRSYEVLGCLCRKDGELGKAWDLFHQAFIKFGTNAEHLGELYFNENYLPDNYDLSDLHRDLEQSARTIGSTSVNYLLRLILQEKGKDSTTISYEKIKEVPEAFEFIRLGAREDAKLLYIYGRLLLESEGKLYNPYVGMDCISSAADRGSSDAIYYLIGGDFVNLAAKDPKIVQAIVKHTCLVGKNTRFVIENYSEEQGVDFVNWLYESMRVLLYEDTDLYYECFSIFQRVIDANKSDFAEWIDKHVAEFINDGDDYDSTRTYMPQYAYLLATKLSMSNSVIDDSLILLIREVINPEYNLQDISRVHYYKNFVQELWPDYSYKAILDGDFSNKRDLAIFYGLNNVGIPDIPLELSDTFNDYLSGVNIDFPNEFQGLFSTQTKVFYELYKRLSDAYHHLVKKGYAQELEDDFLFDIDLTPICCYIDATLQYCLNGLMMLIASREAFGERWQEISRSINDMDRLFEIANGLSNQDGKTILEMYSKLAKERDRLLYFNVKIGCCTNNQLIIDMLNSIIEELDANGIAHKFHYVDNESIPEDIKGAMESVNGLKCSLKSLLCDK